MSTKLGLLGIVLGVGAAGGGGLDLSDGLRFAGLGGGGLGLGAGGDAVGRGGLDSLGGDGLGSGVGRALGTRLRV